MAGQSMGDWTTADQLIAAWRQMLPGDNMTWDAVNVLVDEIERLYEFLQHVADYSTDPRMVRAAYALGAMPQPPPGEVVVGPGADA